MSEARPLPPPRACVERPPLYSPSSAYRPTHDATSLPAPPRLAVFSPTLIIMMSFHLRMYPSVPTSKYRTSIHPSSSAPCYISISHSVSLFCFCFCPTPTFASQLSSTVSQSVSHTITINLGYFFLFLVPCAFEFLPWIFTTSFPFLCSAPFIYILHPLVFSFLGSSRL